MWLYGPPGSEVQQNMVVKMKSARIFAGPFETAEMLAQIVPLPKKFDSPFFITYIEVDSSL